MRPKRILIVEDQFVTALELKEMLEANHYEVAATAYSGPEGVAMARKHKPDLILMDIKMPGDMDGIEAARILRRDLDIPSIFLTGHDKPELIRRAREANPLGYILKPLHRGQIVAALEMAFEEREKEIQFRKSRQKTEKLLKKNSRDLFKAQKRLQKQSENLARAEKALDILSAIRETHRPYSQEPHPLHAVNSPEAELAALQKRFPDFTPQELRIARLLKQGKSNALIAKTLQLSQGTIGWHRKNMRKKIGIDKTGQGLLSALLSLHSAHKQFPDSP